MTNEKVQELREAPLTYTLLIKLDKLNFAKHKFVISGFNQKKVNILIFKSGLDEELLFTLREFHNMVVDFNFTATLNQTQRAYKFFGETIWGAARDTCWEILLGPNINTGMRDEIRLPLHLVASWNAHMSMESFDNQLTFMQNTRKPRLLSVKTCLRPLKALNAYLPLLDAAHPKFTDQELVQHCIAPNIPDQWTLNFRLARGHLAGTVLEASGILEEIERDKLKSKKKETSNYPRNKGNKNNRSGGDRNRPRKGGNNNQ